MYARINGCELNRNPQLAGLIMKSYAKPSDVLESGDKISCEIGVGVVESTIPGFVIVSLGSGRRYEVCDDCIDLSEMSFEFQYAEPLRVSLLGVLSMKLASFMHVSLRR